MNVSPIQKRQILIFVTGWVAYASTYFLRKPLGVIKTDLESQLHITKSQLGWLDTALLLPYAIMQLLLSSVGDKFGPRKTLGLCMIVSGLSMISFGFWSNFSIFVLLLFINGCAQATCWPNMMKTLGQWFSDESRNSVFGLFGTCAFAGGILGTILAVHLQTNYGWRNVFWIPSLIVAGMGLAVLLLFKTPDQLNITIPGKEVSVEAGSSPSPPTALTFWQIISMTMIPEISLAVFCLKVVRYCMYMWLPMYLHDHLKYTTVRAGMFSITFEIGGIVGSALIGIFIDRFFKNRNLMGTGLCVLLSALCLTFFHLTSSWGYAVNSAWLFLSGIFNCGPDSILGGSIPSELGDRDGKNAAAATVGFVNGIGSVGTFIQGPLIGMITTRWSWSLLFYILAGLSFLGTASIYKAAWQYEGRTMK